MSKMRVRLIKYLLIGLSGPAVTFWLYVMSEGEKGAGVLLLPIAIGVVISVVVSSIIQSWIHRMMVSILLSTVISEIGYIALTVLYIYVQQSAVGLMWLPLIIVVMILYAFPMALSVSYSNIKVIRTVKLAADVANKDD